MEHPIELLTVLRWRKVIFDALWRGVGRMQFVRYVHTVQRNDGIGETMKYSPCLLDAQLINTLGKIPNTPVEACSFQCH